jgi:site-specific recombinase XerD
MKFSNQLSDLIQAFFNERMIGEMDASPHTKKSYSYTFQLLLQYAEKALKKRISQLTLEDLNYQFIRNFLNYLTMDRKIKSQSLNVRLTAIRSFFHYIEPHMPEYSAAIAKILSIKNKRTNTELVDYIDEKEIEALLKAPNQKTWIGCRDHCLLMFAIQTGLRVSEITSLRWKDVIWGEHPNVHCIGKGRKERNIPLTRQSAKILHAWSKNVVTVSSDIMFPTIKGSQMSTDAVEYLVTKYAAVAAKNCPSLKKKKITPHVLRHTTAMRLLHTKVGLAGIALYLGHESLKTTYRYLNASIDLKEEIINSTSPLKTKTSRFHPKGKILMFLNNIVGSNKGGEST